MRRPALVALLLLSGSLLALPGRAAPPEAWTSYDVTLAPLPSSLTGCAAGVDDVHRDLRTVVAPYDGRLEVQMPSLSGDFDIGLIDEAGEYVGGGGFGDQTFGPSTTEQAFARVRRGTRLTVMVCNYSSAEPTAVVRYRFVRATPTAPVAKGFRALAPGSLPDLRERVPVNVVLVGYGSEVDLTAMRRALPQVNRPHERMASFYGHERPLGITWTYDYRLVRADRAYQDRFFAQLLSLGTDHGLTAYQVAYNNQQRNAVTVDDALRIPAGAVERWLAEHPPQGVDTRQDTVFLINWWGRRDFRFHTYAQELEPVNDTGRRVGAEDFSALIAWGGSTADDPETGLRSTRRVWFHDLSAGPDYWTGSWSVDSADLDGDGRDERRMLPTWEYGRSLPRAQLGKDLADLVRYTAVNLLFTPSPLYSLRPQAPVIARTVDVDVNVHDLDPTGSNAVPYQPGVLARSVGGLSPQLRVTSDLRTLTEDDPEHAACYAHSTAVYTAASQGAYLLGPGCLPQYRYGAYDDLFVYAASRIGRFLDDKAVDREIPVFSYHVADRVSSCYAYADDNHRDGTPSMVFGVFPSSCRASIGTTDILTHEVGHELGLSHPHDGYDYELDRDYGAWGDTFFVGIGDAVSSVMSYLFVNNEYSQFDRDNHARFLVAAYLTEVNGLAGKVLARPGRALADLRAADAAAVRAAELFAAHAYGASLAAARAAYDSVLRAAARAGVAVTASTAGTDLTPTGPDLGFPKGRGYARAHVLDPRTGLPCSAAAPCAYAVPRIASRLGGPTG